MCRHAEVELMLVIAWASVGIALTVLGGVAQVIGVVLLGLLALLLFRGLVDTWKHERELRDGVHSSPDGPGAQQDDGPGHA